MSDYDPASPDEGQARRPRARRLVSNRRSGDSWPHHIFVTQDFKAVGAE